MDLVKLKEFFQERDRFARGIGIKLTDIQPGYARAELLIEERHLNGVDRAQGGAIFTLADLAFAAAVNSRENAAVGVNSTISFVKAGGKGLLVAEAKETSCNPKLATYTVNVIDESGDLVAIFQGLAYRKRESIADWFEGQA